MVHFKAVQRNLFSPKDGVAAFCTLMFAGLTCITQSAKMTQSYSGFYHSVYGVSLICVEWRTGRVIITLLEACVVGWKSRG